MRPGDEAETLRAGDGEGNDPEETRPCRDGSGELTDPTLPADTKVSSAGRVVGDYELLGEIAQGGMGVVYRARQLSLGRIVALKMIRSGPTATREDVERFRTEAEAAASLDHPHIVPIYEVGEQDGQHFFSMKLVEGTDLRRALPELRSSLRKAMEALVAVTRAVHFAHQRGVLHRDLKPANILVDRDGRPYVTDFGLARRIESDSTLTRTGSVVGTPAYMAPEQAAGRSREVTTATDVYSLGAILYEILAGRPPFREESPMATILAVVEGGPEPPRRIDARVDRDLETICMKCLEKDPALRYPSADALANDRDRWLRGESVTARNSTPLERAAKWARRRPAVAALAAALALTWVAGTAGVTLLWRQAEGDRRVAVSRAEAETRARREAEEARRAEGKAREGEAAQRQEAEAARAVAVAEAARAEESGQSTRAALYVTSVAQAYLEWVDNDEVRAEELLGACPPELRSWEWLYLKRKTRPAPQFQVPVAGSPVLCLDASGTLLAVGEREGGVALHSAVDGRQLWNRRIPAFNAIAISANGARVAVAGGDRSVTVLDATNGREIWSSEILDGPVPAVALSPDGTKVAAVRAEAAQRSGEVLFWTTEGSSSTPPVRIEGHPYRAVLAFGPDGDTVALAASARTLSRGLQRFTGSAIHLLNSSGQRAPTRLETPGLLISGLVFGPGGGTLAASVGDRDQSPEKGGAFLTGQGEVLLLDVAGETRTSRLTGSAAQLTSVSVSPDGRSLLAGSASGLVRVWEPGSTRERTFRGQRGAVLSVAWATAETVAAVDRLGDLRQFRVADAEGRGLQASGGVTRLACADRGGRLAAGTISGDVELWDSRKGARLSTLAGSPAPRKTVGAVPGSRRIAGVAISRDGSRVASAARTGDVRLFDAASGSILLERRPGEGAASPLPASGTALALSGDGRLLAYAIDGKLSLDEASSGRTVRSLALTELEVRGLAFDPGGALLAAAVTDGKASSILLLAAADGARRDLPLGAPPRGAISFSPDGMRLAVAGTDGRVTAFDAASGRRLWTRWCRSRGDTTFSPDGLRVVTLTSSGIRLLSSATGDDVFTLPRQGPPPEGLAFDPETGTLAVGGEDGVIRLLEAEPRPAPAPAPAAGFSRPGP